MGAIYREEKREERIRGKEEDLLYPRLFPPSSPPEKNY